MLTIDDEELQLGGVRPCCIYIRRYREIYRATGAQNLGDNRGVLKEGCSQTCTVRVVLADVIMSENNGTEIHSFYLSFFAEQGGSWGSTV